MKVHVVSRKNQFRSILLMMVLMAITIVVILKDYSVKELTEVIKSTHPFYLIAGIILMFLYAGCQAMNFFLVMGRLGQTKPYRQCIGYAYIGNYFGAITPGASGGQPAQMYYMSKDKINIDLSTITIFYLVFTSQIVIILMGGLLAIFRFHILAKAPNWFMYILIAGSMVMLGLIIILSALMFSKKVIPFLVKLAIKFGEKIHLIKKPEVLEAKADVLIWSYQDKSKIILKHPDLFIKVFFVTVLQWTAYCMVSYLVYLSFGYREFNALDLMAGQSFINIAVAAVPVPGSVGVAEKAFLNIYGQFYAQQELPSAMILSRIINFYLPLLISFLVYLLAHYRIMKAHNKK